MNISDTYSTLDNKVSIKKKNEFNVFFIPITIIDYCEKSIPISWSILVSTFEHERNLNFVN
jgi:hypothetical protein